MVYSINTAANIGMKIQPVSIEVDVSGGIPDFRIVGVPDVAVKESKERVRSAIRNSGLEFPLRRIVVNLAPANIKKEGAFFDLPIAIAILKATGQIKKSILDNYIFIGELSLDGKLRAVNGVLAVALHYSEMDNILMIPEENGEEVSLTGQKFQVFNHLLQVVKFLNEERGIEPKKNIGFHFLKEKNSKEMEESPFDFSHVRGQKLAKRAIEIAVAGGHNILLKGSPGTGKTMLARCIPGILPELHREEALEITKIYSIAGELNKKKPVILQPPFRNPHHTSSRASLIGGGSIPKPGEVSLSHLGILFLDELPEFSRNVLESLREPLEDGEVTIARINAKINFPADFMLVASMNPCPCGYLGSSAHTCTCTEYQINKYKSKISGPLLDRIDLIVNSREICFEDLHKKISTEEKSSVIKERIVKIRGIQKKRFQNGQFTLNGKMSKKEINRFCILDNEGEVLLREAYEFLKLSARAYDKILRVSRTIADLNEHSDISVDDISEAIQYRE